MQALNLRSLWQAFFVGMLALVCLLGADIVAEHAQIDTEERKQLTTQATVVDQNLTRSLLSVKAAIDTLDHDLPWMLGQHDGSLLVNNRLQSLVNVLIGARTLLIMNADGAVIASNQSALIGQNFQEGERFRAIRQESDPARLVISSPFRTPLGVYAIGVGKKMVDDKGRFAGAILAIIDPEFFDILMNSVRYSDDMRASVIHGDGKVIFSTNASLDTVKTDLHGQPAAFFNRHLDSGRTISVFSGIATTTQDERLAVVRTVGAASVSMDKPLVIIISRAHQILYASWRHRALVKSGSLGVLIFLGAVAILFHGRRQREFVRMVAAREAGRLHAQRSASSERFIRTITDAMPGLVAYFDLDLRCQFANKAYQAWYQQPAQSILGQSLQSLLGATLFAANERLVSAALAGQHQQFERFLTRPDGSVGHVLANYIPDIDADGRILGFIIVVADIKAIKMAESELKLAAKVFACISEAIMVTDSKDVILSVNPAFTGITGYSAQEAVGQTPGLLRSPRQSAQFYAAKQGQIRDTGLWQGEIWSRKKSGELFLERQTTTRIAGAHADEDRYVAVFQDITATWEKNEHIRQLAFHDGLTNLPNRRLLMERIERHIVAAGRRARGLAVLFLDLDRFKVINDDFGHAAGDELLVTVARRLQGLLREADTVARLGGDEFVVLLDNPVNRIEIERVVQLIIAVVNEPMVSQDKTARVGTSVGIAVYPDDGAKATTLLKNADLAMYEAKNAGRNTFRFFMPVEESLLAVPTGDAGHRP
ncbi:diguanylate cyclase [Actimicrobium sp. CCC2.4]|uniref:diguanylate cyclase domain-containing protein n=1 Tax=Actimicrobium sp. CCC2.4 TaxID=3048606 RepID=UPI002AC97690|nr:diguanylate cyclase [Actimicrobium sp. CCC2.4]WPX30914.1 diguanylate cyclase [Actimicrobium sp. CCC2.4]